MSTYYRLHRGQISIRDLKLFASESNDLEIVETEKNNWTIVHHHSIAEPNPIENWLHIHICENGDVVELARYGRSNPQVILNRLSEKFDCHIISEYDTLYFDFGNPDDWVTLGTVPCDGIEDIQKTIDLLMQSSNDVSQ